MQLRKLAHGVGGSLLAAGTLLAANPAAANQDLDHMSQDNRNWVMQTKDYGATHFSKLDEINASNVSHLKVAWTFSTGTLHGHEAARWWRTASCTCIRRSPTTSTPST